MVMGSWINGKGYIIRVPAKIVLENGGPAPCHSPGRPGSPGSHPDLRPALDRPATGGEGSVQGGPRRRAGEIPPSITGSAGQPWGDAAGSTSDRDLGAVVKPGGCLPQLDSAADRGGGHGVGASGPPVIYGRHESALASVVRRTHRGQLVSRRGLMARLIRLRWPSWRSSASTRLSSGRLRSERPSQHSSSRRRSMRRPSCHSPSIPRSYWRRMPTSRKPTLRYDAIARALVARGSITSR